MTRTYVVTGSASGIGAVTAAKLRDRGDRVIGLDLHDAEVEADLSTPAGRAEAVSLVGELVDGPLDAVIASAGVAVPNALCPKVNYFGVTDFLVPLLPSLAESPAPRVVIVSSMASFQPVNAELVDAMLAGDEPRAVAIGDALADDPAAGFLNYTSSKRAISRWIRRESITADWAGAGIALNAVAPGIVVTPMTADLLATAESTAAVDAVVPMPLNYHQSPESVASLLIWLTDVDNTHTTGQTIYCDGGADAALRGDDIWSWNDPA